MPTISETLGAFVEEQDENIINIKLPSDIVKIKQLSAYNTRLVGLFKKFGVSEDNIKIVGFDRGTEWYEVLLEGAEWAITHIIPLVALALQIIEFKKKKTESPETKTEVNAINTITGSSNNITVNQYVVSLGEEKIKEGVEKHVDSVGVIPGKTVVETKNQLINATDALAREIEKGTEIQPSLNPPAYIINNGGTINFGVDYGAIQRIEEQDDETPELPAGEESER